MISLWKLGSLALVGGVLASMNLTAPPQKISVGDEVSYSFRSPLLNGMGVESLDDFAGKPLLVEFWGTR